MSKPQLVFGLHSVQALVHSAPQRVLELFVLQGRSDQRLRELLGQAESQGLAVQSVARSKLDALAEGENHQGVLARCRPAPSHDEPFLFELLAGLERAPLLLVLDGVTDPHNLGACLRTAEAAGVDAVLAPRDKAAGLGPVARKVACGAAEVVPFVSVTNLARTLKQLKREGLWLAGAAGEASTSLYQSDLTGPLALVMGAEGRGLRRLTREHCDFLLQIPMAGSISSLNVSVATGVCLFEAVRQRG